MADPVRSGLPPARPQTPKPTSARDLAPEASPARPPPDLEEVRVRVDGETWTVRVRGRSGRASGGSPPLLLLGFWDADDAGDMPSREILVVGTTLDQLTTETLEAALARAERPRDPDRKVAFFEEGARGRRRRTNENI